ncbi:DUF5996 family protein [Brevundimonas sp.]|uniref:DUF5996 family protein n=1 Tax=Brevundimonas sp. TaxID=1871086 RepID=UPI003D6D5628
MAARADAWPELSAATLWPTMETLQLWTQIVGKARLSQTPWLNQGWHVTLRVSARGLSTGLIPHGGVGFSMEFDFVAGALVIRVSDGGERRVALKSGTVADFYAETQDALSALGVACHIDLKPNEMAEATPFPMDERHRRYDAEVARDYWRALVQVDRVFNLFRTGFLGKCSPVHLFWGAFDLAVTRFSGRPAPLHPGGVPNLPDAVTREAYSHEVSSAGFWPGDPGREPSFYAYAYPAPAGFETAPVSPAAAHWDVGLGEFVLPYEAVRAEDDPDAALCAFLQSTYEAAADLAAWDRAVLECPQGRPRHPRWVG